MHLTPPPLFSARRFLRRRLISGSPGGLKRDSTHLPRCEGGRGVEIMIQPQKDLVLAKHAELC